MDYSIVNYTGEHLADVPDVKCVSFIVSTNIVQLIGEEDKVLAVFDVTKAHLVPY